MSESEDVQRLVKLLDSRFADDQTDLYRRALEQFDRVILRRALEHCDGNLTRAAGLLGLSRVTLRSKLRSLGLTNTKATNAASTEPDLNASHPNTTPTVGNGPQGHIHPSQIQTPLNDPGQNLTRTDRPGTESAEPHLGDAVRRHTAGLHNS
jgi:DNA-binding protein Fis